MIKKIFGILFLTLFLPRITISQWEMVNPLPQGNRIEDIQFVDQNNGWVNCGNNLLKTADGGETWELITFDYFIGPQILNLLNPNELFLAQSNDFGESKIYFSNNRGNTWEPLNLPETLSSSEYITDINFLNSHKN